MKRPLRKKHCFTLIEMIVILIIMAVMAAIVAPRMGDFYQNVKLTSSVHRFKLFIDAARTKAAIDNSASRLIIHPGWRKVSLEYQKPRLIRNPEEAVAYIKKLENPTSQEKAETPMKPEFIQMEGEFSQMELPSALKIKYISVSGARKSSLQEVLITFQPFYQADEIDIVFENNLKQYQGMRLPAGSGIPEKLNVIKED